MCGDRNLAKIAFLCMISIACLEIFISVNARAQEPFGVRAAESRSDWSFEAHPHPTYDDMTDEERRASTVPDNVPGYSPCAASVLASYNIYLDRYPEYAETGNARTNFINWKYQIALSERREATYCTGVAPFHQIGELNLSLFVRKDFYFCGRYSRAPITPME